MKFDFDKLVIGILICICLYSFFTKIKKRDETYYYIETKPYKICNKEIYTTDFTYNQTLDIKALFNEIEYICKNEYNKNS